ncbi:hypothetical protein B0T26DRAFT_654287 [Lasiosphaeria miniovina]|uniref:Peroxin 20 n=1 Tax=Lasiosphaeria miniovina TaxID=1954250 RepID=A0AA40A5B7_9PEZI|nr:uncharacterized protein B0T26DRAFT_654287 [Lasiosphaeria miniovina]KAK0709613.1 hypothetical protein B0T26DRAFT_654287 [Lasiosphaeria miniovina]
MADNMCGPSSGAKSLVAHAERDRTLHQDRLANGPNVGAGASFRSQMQHSGAADMAFEGFQQGRPMDPVHSMSPVVKFNPQSPMNIASFATGAYGNHLSGAPAVFGAGPAGHFKPFPAPDGAPQEWLDQFANMHVVDTAHNGPAMTNQPMAMMMPGPVDHNQLAVGLQQNLMMARPYGAPPMFGTPISAFSHGFQTADVNGTAKVAEASFVGGESNIDVEAFNRAFGEYDEAEFERELTNWKEEQAIADREFIEAQDEWMAEHGPKAEARTVQPPTLEEMAVINTDLEILAQELEENQADIRRHRDDDDLAQAAVDILNSVAGNESEKFKNSNFFQLMRRIGNKEIVVEGPNLIDAVTGETIVPNKDTAQSGLLASQDSGTDSISTPTSTGDKADGQSGDADHNLHHAVA